MNRLFFLLIVVSLIGSCKTNNSKYTIHLNEYVENKSITDKLIDAYLQGGETIDSIEHDRSTIMLIEVPSKSGIKLKQVLIKSGLYEGPKSKFRIGIVDFNNNGRFSDLGIDRIAIGNVNEKALFTHESYFSTPLDSILNVQVDSFFYILKPNLHDDDDNIISVKPISIKLGIEHVDLFLSNSIGSFSYSELNQEIMVNRNFSSVTKKPYLVLVFWNDKCISCIKAVPILKELYKNNFNHIEVLALGRNMKPDTMLRFKKKYGIPWSIGLIDKYLIKLMDVHFLPSYFLLNNEGEIIINNTASLTDIQEYLEIHTNTK